ncbi:MAG: hypothetical protein WAR83_16050 [Flavobacteriales bacterium]|nr:hypothetical protein [Flavobacteriales bacterium]
MCFPFNLIALRISVLSSTIAALIFGNSSEEQLSRINLKAVFNNGINDNCVPDEEQPEIKKDCFRTCSAQFGQITT